jgi:hypothetical protein
MIRRDGDLMTNLLDGRAFIGPCSSESEGLQQPMKISQTHKIDHRRAERNPSASNRIKHPGGEDNRRAWLRLNDSDLPSRSPFTVKLPDPPAKQRMPPVMDFYILPDMGRMTPRLP